MQMMATTKIRLMKVQNNSQSLKEVETMGNMMNFVYSNKAPSAQINQLAMHVSLYKSSLKNVMCLVGILLSMGVFSINANAQTEALNKCKAIDDAAKRLACYDALETSTKAEAKTVIENTVKEAQASGQNRVDQTVSRADQELDDIERRAQALMSKSTNSDKPFSSNTARINSGGPDLSSRQNNTEMDEFGRQTSASDTSKIEGDELFSKVTNVKRDSRDYATFTLSNGQIWRQTEGSQLRIRTGDDITIEQGVFSSYYMSKPGNNRQVRVTRVN